MGKYSISELEAILNGVTSGLSKVTSKKMFGCHAVWVDGNVFALVWKHGRIGVKIPEPSDYQTLMNISGAEPWKAGPMKMAHWVFVPEGYHAKLSELRKWTAKAHFLSSKLEKKSTKGSTKKTPIKRSSKKKTK